MKNLDGEPGATLVQTEPAAPSADASVAGSCASCGEPHAEVQEWCLSCGSRLYDDAGRGPGLRSAAAVVGLTVLLAGGASAASYAALQDEANRQARSPAPPAATPLAQAPGPVAPPGTTPPAVVPPTDGAAAPPAGDLAPFSPSTGGGAFGALPAAPPLDDGGGAGGAFSPAPVPPSGGPSSGGGGTPSGGGSTPPSGRSPSSADRSPSSSSDRSPSSTGGGTSDTAPGEPYPSSVLEPDFYDPEGRIKETDEKRRELRRAIDGSTSTSVTLTGSEGGFGYLVELGANRPLSSLRITGSGGYAVEVHGARTRALPEDISDGDWTKLGELGSVSGTKTVRLRDEDTGDRGSYRTVVVWVPDDARARISELRLVR